MNVINYREDEETLLKLIQDYASNGQLKTLKLATGYFNLQKEFIDIINQNPNTLNADFLTSSPRANGFYKAGAFKKYIPGMYRANELSVLKHSKSNVKIFEYENGEWTFHAKGAWFYEGDTPSMTVIGSSNYSYRSNRRDTEAQLYMVSDCP